MIHNLHYECDEWANGWAWKTIIDDDWKQYSDRSMQIACLMLMINSFYVRNH